MFTEAERQTLIHRQGSKHTPQPIEGTLNCLKSLFTQLLKIAFNLQRKFPLCYYVAQHLFSLFHHDERGADSLGKEGLREFVPFPF